MYLLGHVGLALLLAAPVAFVLVRVGRARTMWTGLVALLGSVMLPDVDLLLLGSLAHRGLTHTVWAALLLGGLFAVAAWRLGAREGDPVETTAFGFGVGVTSVVFHLAGDVITPMGIRPFAPLSGVEYSLVLVAARNPAANLALFVTGVVAFGLALGCAGRGAPVPAGPADVGGTPDTVTPEAGDEGRVSGD